MAVQLVVTMDDAGAVQVSGPIDNLILCFGLLEVAKDVLRKHAERTQTGVQAVAPGQGQGLMQALARRGINGGG